MLHRVVLRPYERPERAGVFVQRLFYRYGDARSFRVVCFTDGSVVATQVAGLDVTRDGDVLRFGSVAAFESFTATAAVAF
jgi:hypothetical protein